MDHYGNGRIFGLLYYIIICSHGILSIIYYEEKLIPYLIKKFIYITPFPFFTRFKRPYDWMTCRFGNVLFHVYLQKNHSSLHDRKLSKAVNGPSQIQFLTSSQPFCIAIDALINFVYMFT
jgi:hypothetical protein